MATIYDIKKFNGKLTGISMFDIISARGYSITNVDNGWCGVVIGETVGEFALSENIVAFPLSYTNTLFRLAAERCFPHEGFPSHIKYSNCEIIGCWFKGNYSLYNFSENRLASVVYPAKSLHDNQFVQLSTKDLAKEIKRIFELAYDKHEIIKLSL